MYTHILIYITDIHTYRYKYIIYTYFIFICTYAYIYIYLDVETHVCNNGVLFFCQLNIWFECDASFRIKVSQNLFRVVCVDYVVCISAMHICVCYVCICVYVRVQIHIHDMYIHKNSWIDGDTSIRIKVAQILFRVYGLGSITHANSDAEFGINLLVCVCVERVSEKLQD